MTSKSGSGQQLAEQNVEAFLAWQVSKSDDDFRAMESRGVLSRKEIAKECGFARSVLDQNPRVKAALRELEDTLRSRLVLPALAERDEAVPLVREAGRLKSAVDSERLKRLEQENAALRAELSELKAVLARTPMLAEALALTGRLPR
jgi:hypothetical protein